MAIRNETPGTAGPIRRSSLTHDCVGHATCRAGLHVHGCFNDLGDCDQPAEHMTTRVQDAVRGIERADITKRNSTEVGGVTFWHTPIDLGRSSGMDLSAYACGTCGVLVAMPELHAPDHTPTGTKAQDSDKPRLYLAGPVYGKPDSNREAFHAAEVLWQGTQYEVVNPLYVPPDEHEGPCSRRTYDGGQADGGPNHNASCYMRTDLYALMTCQAVYMLDGWENSRGARTEWAVAAELGLTITYETPPATPWTLQAVQV